VEDLGIVLLLMGAVPMVRSCDFLGLASVYGEADLTASAIVRRSWSISGVRVIRQLEVCVLAWFPCYLRPAFFCVQKIEMATAVSRRG
jgi:hypothetical protein